MTLIKSAANEILSFPNYIKLIAFLVGAVYLSSRENLLLVLGDAIILALIVFALLFYIAAAIKILRIPGAIKTRMAKVVCLPILHTEPLALVITAFLTIRYHYGKAAPDAGSMIAIFGMLLCIFSITFLLVNFFLNIIKYWNKERLYGDRVSTGGLAKRIFPYLAAHIVGSAVLLSLLPAFFTFAGIFIREQSLSFQAVKKYPDIIAAFVALPLGLWFMLRLMRQFRPPLSVNLARVVALSLKDLHRAGQVKTPDQFLKVLEIRNRIFGLWLKIHRFPPRIHREMAVNYLYLKNYDLAVHHFQNYLKGFNPKKLKLERELVLVPFLADGASKVLFKRYRSFYKNSIRLLEENFVHLEQLHPMKALQNFEEAKKEVFTPEMDFVYSLFLEMLCERFKDYHLLLPQSQKEKFTGELITSKSRQQWQETIALLLAHPEEYRRENLGESFNVVFEISNKNYFRDAFVLKGQINRENLLKERQNTENLRSIVEDFPQFLVPVPLHITEDTISYNGHRLYVYTMRRNRGVSILELNKRDRQIAILKNAAEYLALIHARMPANSFITDYRAKVSDKFNNIGVENRLTQKVVKSITPVIESFADAVLVFGKDAHPGNWLVTGKGELVALDMEDKGVVPLEIDLVNLLEFDSFNLNRRERENLKMIIISEYVKYYKKYSRNVKSEPFSLLRYLNAVIQRMLCLYCFWNSLSRDPANVKCNFVLDNALYAMEELSQRFSDYFSKHGQDYNNLKIAINRLKKEIN